jgi:hypothetical protein
MCLKRVMKSLEFFSIYIRLIVLVFSRDYYANITMRLNRTKTIPNSTDVWWEMSEHKNKYDFIPSCK